jgi:hypothetical protein
MEVQVQEVLQAAEVLKEKGVMMVPQDVMDLLGLLELVEEMEFQVV